MTRLLVAAALLSVASAALAQRLPVLVKTEQGLVVTAPPTYDIVSMSCQASFGDASRVVNYSDDPDPHASSPLFRQLPCPYYDTDVCDIVTGKCYAKDGYRDYVFYLSFWSLWDIRNYDVKCSGYMVQRGKTYWDINWQEVRPCCSNPCEICVADCVEPIPGVLPLTVYNYPATVTMNVPSTATCPGTVAVSGSASDSDGGLVRLRWTATAPNGTTTQVSGTSTATFSVTRSGTWQIRLDADDNEGERTTQSRTFTTTIATPTITIDGKRSVTVMVEPIELTVSSASNNCGTLTTTWDVLSTPPGASVAPQTGYRTGPGIAIVTRDEKDIGTWTFKATSTIAGKSTSETVSVQVTNRAPQIALEGPHEVSVGGAPGVVRTTILEDADGGFLSFDWELVQAPASAGVVPGPHFSRSESVSIPTSQEAAGTWIFRLTVTDNDGAPNSSVTSDPFSVVVDALPVASIQGRTLVARFDQIDLDGSGSVDPDSPCPNDPMRCHVTTGGPPQDISPGIVSLRWYVDPPTEYWDRYLPGPASDALGVPDTGSTLHVDRLEPGDWVFRLEIIDGEGNSASADVTVTVLFLDTPPLVIVSPPGRYIVDALGTTAQAIVVTGAASFDPDNLAAGEALVPGLGITAWQWQLSPPPGCSYAPLQPSGTSTLTLYPAGAAVPLACQGSWWVTLAATDDDTSAQTGYGTTQLVIGNCQGTLCIDAPKTVSPRIVNNADLTDVTVIYHLDSALVSNPAFQYGYFTVMQVFADANPAVPVFEAYDPNPLAALPGALLSFNWNGYDLTGMRVDPGFYGVRITLVDGNGQIPNLCGPMQAAPCVVEEPRSIWIEVADIGVSLQNAVFHERYGLVSGTDTVNVVFHVSGAVALDQICWKARNDTGATVAFACIAGAFDGVVSWDGKSGAEVVPSGRYTIQVEAFRTAQLLASSERVAVVIGHMGVELVGGQAAGPFIVYVNSDDDNQNGVSDADESLANDDEIAGVNLVIDPVLAGNVTLAVSGDPALMRAWTNAQKGAAVDLPTTYTPPAQAVPATVYVEALAPGLATLQLSYVLSDGTALPLQSLDLDLVDLRVLDQARAQARSVSIARWEGAYVPAGGPIFVANNPDANAPGNLVENDPRRFYVEVSDPAMNQDPAIIETITVAGADPAVTVETRGRIQDAPTRVTLTETGPDTGVFVSRSHFLTTEDHLAVRLAPGMPLEATDDAFQVHVGIEPGGPVPDNDPDDRTHQADISGDVRVGYRPPGAVAAHTIDVPVCQRAPEYRRRVMVQPVILDGAVPAAFIDEEAFRAVLSWQQACIFVTVAPTWNRTAPLDARGVSILADGWFDITDDIQPVVDAFAPASSVDVVYVFFVPKFANLNPYAFTIGPDSVARGKFVNLVENTFVFVAADADHRVRVLAHELGHSLENADRDNDAGINPWEFYPAPVGLSDIDVTQFRRITATTETNCRLTRAPGDLGAPGSRLLRMP